MVDQSGEDTGINGHITGIEEMGSESFVHLDLLGRPVICKLISPEHSLQHGSVQNLRFRMDKCHIFDSETGKNLSLTE